MEDKNKRATAWLWKRYTPIKLSESEQAIVNEYSERTGFDGELLLAMAFHSKNKNGATFLI